MLSCLTCLVPYVLSCPAVSWPTCSRALRVLLLDMPSALYALVLYVLRALAPLMPRVMRALMLDVPRALNALVLYVPSMLSCLTCIVLYVFFTSRVLCLAYSRGARELCNACSFPFNSQLASGFSSLTYSYASYILYLSCLYPLVLLVLELFEFFTVFNHSQNIWDKL